MDVHPAEPAAASTLIVPFGSGYLVHDHSGPQLQYGMRTEFIQCRACTLIATANPWPLEWDAASCARYAAQFGGTPCPQ